MKLTATASLAVFIFCSASAAQQTDAFGKDVYPILQASNCRACHTEGGLAAATRLRFPASNATAEQIAAFGRSLASLVNRSVPEQSVLLSKPTNREKHTGGQLIRPGGRQEAALLAWIREVAASAPAAKTAVQSQPAEAASQPKLRRLTHSQYNNTVRDLLGDETRPADRFPLEDYVNGFKNQTAAQDISPILAEAYNLAAERLAKAAFQGGTDERDLIPCVPRSHQDANCRSEFVRSFGLRAFRRPLSDVERTRYERVFHRAAQQKRSFTEGAQVVVEAMLQSPKFLFHSGGAVENRAWEIASKLSYFFWDTMPDRALFDSAAAGELLIPSGLDSSIQRMLRDPRLRQGVDQFVAQWLRFDLALGAVKDRASYPEFTPELAAAMAEETRLLVADVVSNDRSFMQVFTAGHTFINSDLARLYGIAAPATEFAKVPLAPDSGRAGIIGQALFLALTSKPGETSPTVRGYFVREHFLCQQVPDPPPGTNANLPPLSVAKPQTTRDRLGEHTTNPSCRGCHSLMDPIGFGLEGFDAIGRRREKERLTFMPDRRAREKKAVTVELPLNAHGVVEGISGSAFSSASELGLLLARSKQCQECVVRQWFRYAFGRRESDSDRAHLERATAIFRESDFRLTALMAYLGKILAFPDGRD